ncbi:MAG: hypothetical protein OFPI_36540 [Osedax symbiont Rs2]|nr:MAG: hypothetical protein OFPI_36540 [Osedax symbiont Rs2]
MKNKAIIVGAGPSGLSTACALALIGVEVVVIDKQTDQQLAHPEEDGRDIAMAHKSKSILSSWGVWQRFCTEDIHPLVNAKVSTQGLFNSLVFERKDNSDEPLGFLIANHKIRKALYQQARELENISFELGCAVMHSQSSEAGVSVLIDSGKKITAQLLVAADSRFSVIRRMMGIGASMTDYGRVMMVCNMRHSKSHDNTARESFLYSKTCATLPLGPGISSVVITVPASVAHKLVQLSDEQFNIEATKVCSDQLGTMQLIGKRYSYPLVGTYSNRFIGERFALVGDAAVGMHPVTAHGFNLALRSADTLACNVKNAINNADDIGSAKVLRNYELRHQFLAKPIYEGTNALVKLFTNDHPVAKIARKAAIIAGNILPGFKSSVVRRLTQTS